MSLRKALLKLLALRGKDTVSATAVITSELLAGGVKSSAESFTSNVSATLSVMKSKHEEVSYAEDGWSITEKGLINASQTQNILRGKYNWKKKRIKL